MICPKCAVQMVNYIENKEIGLSNGGESLVILLPNGGIAEDDVYETWYEYACPACDRRVRESYKCEVLVSPKNKVE